jgi:hypothetical protein
MAGQRAKVNVMLNLAGVFLPEPNPHRQRHLASLEQFSDNVK